MRNALLDANQAMTPTYDWICKYCGAPNAAGKSNCANCLRAAWASPREIEAVHGAQPDVLDAIHDEIPKSPVLKVLWVLFVALMIGGGLIGKFAGPISLNLVGLAMAGIGAGGLYLIRDAVRTGHG